MTKIGTLGVMVLFAVLPATWAADAPHELGGFVLGGKVEDFRDKIRPETVLPVRYAESLKEVEVQKTAGFKTGLIYYGTCSQPSRILRIEFKYDDPTEKFFRELLQRFKKRHGDPDEWRGDPFHVELGWKWKFIDADNNDISLILKHNTEDEERKEGNYVKMTMWNLMNEEISCYKDRRRLSEISPANGVGSPGSGTVDWNLLVPK